MLKTQNAADVLNRDFLTIRERLLQIAAGLDRVERAEGTIADDPRWQQLADGIREIAKGGGDRAERFQMAFSDDYDATWKDDYGIVDRS